MPRIAIIDKLKCKPTKCKKECMKRCPIQQTGRVVIDIEDIGVAKIDETGCNGCNQCVSVCPYNAIKIVNIPEKVPNEIIHRYGENEFQLYRLPKLVKNKVITLIGQNGIGKSTVLDILIGKIYPNFGNLSVKQDILKMFGGSVLKTYFTQLYNGTLIFSIKTQKIKHMRENIITIKEYIELNNLYINDWYYALELHNKQNTNINNLSGGELQRFYCWVTCNIRANVYIFDEPTNFLDIKQRLIVSQMIKSLVSPDTYVVTVEHDMSIADYLSDDIVILYGEPGSYGVVSDLLTVSNGINEYLEGNISSINLRFRDYPFNLTPTNINEEKIVIVPALSIPYKGATILYPDLQLTIPDNNVCLNGSINIILGANGTGKTTFMKHICKSFNSIVSYKPQELHSQHSDKTVLEYLYCDKYNSPLFKSQVKNVLKIGSLEKKLLTQLSGGELQKVMICKTLCKDANIYLLDEPSSNLDIESRMDVIKAIKRFMQDSKSTIYIIEHDIMMCMSLSLEYGSRTIIFKKYDNVSMVYMPDTVRDGINMFLQELNITIRTGGSNRPRINKHLSTMDKKQKLEGNYYV
jgi:ATP-binding cassette subfamily E protein 1